MRLWQNRPSSVFLGRVLINLTPMEGKFDDIKESYVFSQLKIEKCLLGIYS